MIVVSCCKGNAEHSEQDIGNLKHYFNQNTEHKEQNIAATLKLKSTVISNPQVKDQKVIHNLQ